jgi:outer membrane protein TolC
MAGTIASRGLTASRGVATLIVLGLAALALAGCTTREGDNLSLDVATAEVAAQPPRIPLPVPLSDDAATPDTSSDDVAVSRSRGTGLTLPPHLRDAGAVATAAPAQMATAPATAGSTADGIATGSIGATRLAGDRARPRQRLDLTKAVTGALLTYPEIRAHEARVRETRAGVDAARAPLFPQADLRLAAGANFSGSYEGNTVPYKVSSNNVDGRLDGGVVLRQLLFDFGATRSEIARAELLRDAEKLRLREKIDDVAGKTAQAYLRVLENRALLSLVDEVVAAHLELARVVAAHAQEGHGTNADVQRVNARLVDVRAIRADVSLQLSAAEDQLERLTRVHPGQLAPTPDLRRRIPASDAAATALMLSNNPRLAAIQTTTRSSEKELEAQKASTLPRINLEVDGESKNFRNGPDGRTQAEARAMVAMRYRFLDGGLADATKSQILARIENGEFTYLNEREQMEADLRQAYRAIDSAGRKLKLVSEGVTSAREVRALYLEQFKGGKRTVFELLDSQMSFFTVRRSQIESQFSGQRAIFEILRITGQLATTLAAR